MHLFVGNLHHANRKLNSCKFSIMELRLANTHHHKSQCPEPQHWDLLGRKAPVSAVVNKNWNWWHGDWTKKAGARHWGHYTEENKVPCLHAACAVAIGDKT
jgi:hypothetical protein